MPHNPNPDEQRRFLEEELLPRLAEAKTGQREVWFVDASHFLYSAVLGFLWCWVRLFVPGPTGRKRVSILGAVNAISREVPRVGTAGKVNAEVVVALLRKLTHGCDGPPVPGPKVTVILDNARYQKTWWVQLAAQWYDIELVYLPAYSPNLNLIERLWKFVKKEALACRAPGSFEAFQQAIERCLAETATTHQDELRSLLTLNFQLLDDVPTLAA